MPRKRMPFVLVVSGVLISLSAFPQRSLNKLHSGPDDENSALDGAPTRKAGGEDPVKPKKQKRFEARTVGSVNAFSRQRGFEIQ
jgi:hypothetical protein